MNGTYRVIWRRELSDRLLVEFVVQAMQRGEDVNAITQAVNTIDQLLSTRPESRGESRTEYERVLIVPPLTATYEVHEEEQVVFVIGLHYHPLRPQ
jgi:hypothetical protein